MTSCPPEITLFKIKYETGKSQRVQAVPLASRSPWHTEKGWSELFNCQSSRHCRYHVCLIQVISLICCQFPTATPQSSCEKALPSFHLESAQMTCGRQGGKLQKTFCPGRRLTIDSSRWGYPMRSGNIDHQLTWYHTDWLRTICFGGSL